MENKKTLLFNSRLITVLFIGFASGLPLALTASTLQAWFTQAHVSLITIGSLSLLGLPYSLKFLWAPLMDQYCLPFFSKRKGWMLLTLLCTSIGIFVLANMDPQTDLHMMYGMAMILVFFSASQDIAIDAYRTDVLEPQERGLGAAYFVFAYRIGLLVAGGLSLICADYLGWKLTYEIMALLLLLSLLPMYRAPAVVEYPQPSNHLFKTMLLNLRDLLQREKIVWLLLFVLFYKFGDALALSLMTNFLLHGLGFTLTQIGVAYKIVGVVATFLGGFLGGFLLLRISMYYALLYFSIAQAGSNLFFVLLAMVGKNFALMTTSIFIENFCSGMSTAAFFAFLMSLCNKRYTASQYAFFIAIASVGRVFLGPVAALMVQNMGWVQFYLCSVIVCIPGILFLILLKDNVLEPAHAPAA